MKRAGDTSPSSGSRQRISASAPTTAPLSQVDLRLVVQAEAAADQRLAHRVVELHVRRGGRRRGAPACTRKLRAAAVP